MPEWLQHLLTALGSALGGAGLTTWITAYKAKHEVKRIDADTNSVVLEQANTIVGMWQQLGKSLGEKVDLLESRVKLLEVDLKTKADRIEELEEMNERKDERIKELETQVGELERKVQQLENSRQPRKRVQ